MSPTAARRHSAKAGAVWEKLKERHPNTPYLVIRYDQALRRLEKAEAMARRRKA